jgi:hypothetical protein
MNLLSFSIYESDSLGLLRLEYITGGASDNPVQTSVPHSVFNANASFTKPKHSFRALHIKACEYSQTTHFEANCDQKGLHCQQFMEKF